MKKISILLVTILAVTSCNPYQKLSEPVMMNYSIDGILCREYAFKGDTLILFDAGYSASKTKIKRATTIKLVGGSHIIVKI